MENLLGGATREVGAGLEHRVGVRLDVLAADLGQLLGSVTVLGRTGGGAERERVGENGREHEARNVGRNLHSGLGVGAVDDRAGAANGLGAVVDGCVCLDGANAVVVENLHDLGLVKAVHGLRTLGVIDENDVLALDVDEVGRAHQAKVGAVLVDDGEEAVTRLCHDLARVVHGRVDRELQDALAQHLGAHRHGHADEARGGEGVVRRGDDGAAVALGGGNDALGHVGTAADDQAPGVALDGELLCLVAVGDQHDVAGLDGVLHHLGRGAHAHVALGHAAVGVAQKQRAVERLDDVLVGGLGLGEHGGVEDVHVRVGNVLHRDEAFEVLVLIGDAEGIHLGVLHHVPGGEEAHLGVDAGLLLHHDVLDLRRHRGDERRLLEAKVLEHKCRLAVEGACAPCLVDRLVDLVLEVSVGNGGADAVRVRMQVADNVDLADCLWHESPSVLFAPCPPPERSRPYRCIPSPSIVPPVVTKKMHAWAKPQVLGMQRHPIVHKR